MSSARPSPGLLYFTERGLGPPLLLVHGLMVTGEMFEPVIGQQRGSLAVSPPRRLAIEAPSTTLADLRSLAAEHGHNVAARHDQED